MIILNFLNLSQQEQALTANFKLISFLFSAMHSMQSLNPSVAKVLFKGVASWLFDDGNDAAWIEMLSETLNQKIKK